MTVRPSKDVVFRKKKSVETKRDNYREILKYSRNYAQLMQDLTNGTVPQELLLPQKREARRFMNLLSIRRKDSVKASKK
jgi:hypothetical protein